MYICNFNQHADYQIHHERCQVEQKFTYLCSKDFSRRQNRKSNIYSQSIYNCVK